MKTIHYIPILTSQKALYDAIANASDIEESGK